MKVKNIILSTTLFVFTIISSSNVFAIKKDNEEFYKNKAKKLVAHYVESSRSSILEKDIDLIIESKQLIINKLHKSFTEYKSEHPKFLNYFLVAYYDVLQKALTIEKLENTNSIENYDDEKYALTNDEYDSINAKIGNWLLKKSPKAVPEKLKIFENLVIQIRSLTSERYLQYKTSIITFELSRLKIETLIFMSIALKEYDVAEKILDERNVILANIATELDKTQLNKNQLDELLEKLETKFKKMLFE